MSGPAFAVLLGLPFTASRLHAQSSIVVTNYPDTQVVTYPLALLRGTLPAGSTTLSVTNLSSSRTGTKTMDGVVRQGRFRALADLIPGDNILRLHSGPLESFFSLRYIPQTNPRIVRPMLYTLSDGSANYSTPLAADPQNWQTKLEVMMKILQTFTAESMHDKGFPRLTFNLPMDPATGAVQTWKLVGEHDAAFYYNQTYNRDSLWNEAYSLIDRNLPDANAKNLVIIGFSKYDATLNYKYAHVALGGGHLGMMGGLSFWAYPDSLPDILPTYMDGSTAYPHLQGENDTVALAANDNIGAALHELGHAMGRPHEGGSQSIMSRGFDRMYRFFTLSEPSGATWPEDQIGEWDPASAAAFAANHPWFAYPPPVARWEVIAPDPLPEALFSLNLYFDQPVTGVDLGDFTFSHNGTTLPSFASQAVLTPISDSIYRLNPGLMADAQGTFSLTLKAGSGITNAAGLSLQEDRVRQWSRGTATLPQWGSASAHSATVTSAAVAGLFMSNGGTSATGTLYFGLTDAGPQTTGWTGTIPLGALTRGTITRTLTALQSDQIYFFRWSAINALGSSWSTAGSFRTEKAVPSIDVTRADSTVSGTSTNFPEVESPAKAIDNLATTKYLNFNGAGSGLRVTLAAPRAVRALNVISADDEPGRDPASYLLRGSENGTDYTTLGTGTLGTFPSRFLSKMVLIPSGSQPWLHYELVFPNLANSSPGSMQTAEVQLLEYPPILTGATITGTAAIPTPGEGVAQLTDSRLDTKMGFTGTQILTLIPAAGLVASAPKGLNLITANDNSVYHGRSPQSIRLEGSLDGTSYTTLYNRTGLPALNQDYLIDEHTFVENAIPYRRYRLHLGAGAGGFTQIAELQLFGLEATGYGAWIGSHTVTQPLENSDPDGDGVTNLEEYIFNTHPGLRDPAARLVTVHRQPNGQVGLRFRTSPGRTYRVECSPDLTHWRNAGSTFSATVENPAYLWTDDGSLTDGFGRSRFYRIAISVAQ